MIEIKEYNNKFFFFIKYNEYKPSNIEDNKNEYLTKLFKANIKIIDPKSPSEKNLRKKYAEIFWKDQNRKGKTLYDSQKLFI